MNYWTEEEKGLNDDMRLAVAVYNKDWIKQLEHESNQFLKDKESNKLEVLSILNEIEDLKLCFDTTKDAHLVIDKIQEIRKRFYNGK